MADGEQNQDGVPEFLRKQLALAVKTIQWSYAIFWSISSSQTGELEWVDGYYNGDIKTRKTVESVELNADEVGLQRTEQLKELYESLSAAETNPQAKRPSAALSPEDLTDTEWYFLVCMSFVFNTGQGLPGRSLAKNQTIWLCNAHYGDSEVFSRSLLAKSASIQTVVCFPYLEGVLELGVTELVLEDPNLIEHIKTSFLEITFPKFVSKISNYVPKFARKEKHLSCNKLDHDILDTNHNLVVEFEEAEENTCSPNDSSNHFEPTQQAEELVMVEGVNGGGFSQVQSWQYMDEEICNGVQLSINSSDCVSQTIASPKKAVPISNGEVKPVSFDSLEDDEHYQGVLSTLFKTSHQSILGPRLGNKESSFVGWNMRKFSGGPMSKVATPQRLLKRVIFEVTRMHTGCFLESPDDNNGSREKVWRPEADEIDTNHVLSERERMERIDKNFFILGSLVPSNGKVDKESVLDDTITYLRELERRVENLESCKEIKERTRKKPCDVIERTFDNYGILNGGERKKMVMNKRKACDIGEMEGDDNISQPKDISTEVITVSKIEKNVLIEMRCPLRENLLLEIMNATSKLHLDSHSIQSSNVDGILSLTIKAQLKGSKVVSIRTIREAIKGIIQKC